MPGSNDPLMSTVGGATQVDTSNGKKRVSPLATGLRHVRRPSVNTAGRKHPTNEPPQQALRVKFYPAKATKAGEGPFPLQYR
mmetsp:Transcript_50501/g.107229  ORF Transcript_50501/g.107229 Transcript_50501/m.107229 type:complete len:82 (-) Transcript_50501:330-575(-)